MAGTFSQTYIQVAFALQGRETLLQKPWREEIGTKINITPPGFIVRSNDFFYNHYSPSGLLKTCVLFLEKLSLKISSSIAKSYWSFVPMVMNKFSSTSKKESANVSRYGDPYKSESNPYKSESNPCKSEWKNASCPCFSPGISSWSHQLPRPSGWGNKRLSAVPGGKLSRSGCVLVSVIGYVIHHGCCGRRIAICMIRLIGWIIVRLVSLASPVKNPPFPKVIQIKFNCDHS